MLSAYWDNKMLYTIEQIKYYMDHVIEDDEYTSAIKALCNVGECYNIFLPEFQEALAIELNDVLQYLDNNCEIITEELTYTKTLTRLKWLDD